MSRTIGELKLWIAFCACSCTIFCIPWALAKPGTAPEKQQNVENNSYLHELAHTKNFCGRYVGLMNVQTPGFLAYEKALAQGAKIRKAIERLLIEGSPACKLYCAILLQKIDAGAGVAALKRLQSDHSMVASNFGGCSYYTRSVSANATDLLKDPTIRQKLFESHELNEWLHPPRLEDVGK